MSAQSGTTYGDRYVLTQTDQTVYAGTGSPEGVQTGTVGDLYLRRDCSAALPAIYAKLSGTATTTGWVGLASSGATACTAVTTARTLAAADAGAAFTNEGTASGATLYLPPADAGLLYRFMVATAQPLTVVAGSGDTIRLGTQVTDAAGSVTSSVVGSALTLLAISATAWAATALVGEWVL